MIFTPPNNTFLVLERGEETAPTNLKNDSQLIWNRLLPGGWAGFHTYGGNLPEVATATDSMTRDRASEIERVETMKERRVGLVKKRSVPFDLTVKDSHQ